MFDIKNDPGKCATGNIWFGLALQNLTLSLLSAGEMNDLINSTNPEHKTKLQEMRKRFLELKMLANSDMNIVL